MNSNARIQTIALLLLGAFAWLCLDVAALTDVVADYLVVDATDEPQEPRREPTLVGRPEPVSDQEERNALADGGDASSGERESPTSPREPDPSIQPILLPTLVTDSKPVIRNVHRARYVLQLSGRQVDEFQRLLEDHARDLDDLRHLPNEEGATWHRVADRLRPGDVRGRLQWARTVAADLRAFMRTRLRRSDETFEQAQRRIRRSHADVIRDHLTPDQQRVWDRHDVTGLLGSQQPSLPVVRLAIVSQERTGRSAAS